MFESILNHSSGSLNMADALICMMVSIFLGIVVSFVHTIDNKYSKKFILALIVLPLLVQVVIVMVNGNLGTSVAILGAFSLIRFRSMPGNSRELISVFFAMAIGLATGIGHILFAVTFTVIGSVVIILVTKLKFGENRNVKNLKILVPEDLEYENMFNDIFEKYTKKVFLMKAKTVNMGSLYELEYEIELKADIKSKSFLDDLRIKNGNLKVSLSTPLIDYNEL